jgi:hypothetical protein
MHEICQNLKYYKNFVFRHIFANGCIFQISLSLIEVFLEVSIEFNLFIFY